MAASVAQLVEQLTLNQLVPGSSPGGAPLAIKHLRKLDSVFVLALYPCFVSLTLGKWSTGKAKTRQADRENERFVSRKTAAGDLSRVWKT